YKARARAACVTGLSDVKSWPWLAGRRSGPMGLPVFGDEAEGPRRVFAPGCAGDAGPSRALETARRVYDLPPDQPPAPRAQDAGVDRGRGHARVERVRVRAVDGAVHAAQEPELACGPERAGVAFHRDPLDQAAHVGQE